jgi:hypothetical protein
MIKREELPKHGRHLQQHCQAFGYVGNANIPGDVTTSFFLAETQSAERPPEMNRLA